MVGITRLLIWTVIFLTSTANLHAQEGPPGRWWRTPKLVQQLQLTDGEIQQLEKAFEASRLKMIELKGKVETEQFKLQNLVEQRNLEEKAVKAQHRKLENARTELADERFAFFVEVRKIIGAERFQQLLSVHSAAR